LLQPSCAIIVSRRWLSPLALERICTGWSSFPKKLHTNLHEYLILRWLTFVPKEILISPL
jgi:hypothetical protein